MKINRISKLTDTQRKERGLAITSFIDKLNILPSKKGKEIIHYLNDNQLGICFGERWLRHIFEDNNYLWQYGYSKYLIISGRNGYKICQTKEELEKYLRNRENHYKAEYFNYISLKKRAEEKLSYGTTLFDGEN